MANTGGAALARLYVEKSERGGRKAQAPCSVLAAFVTNQARFCSIAWRVTFERTWGRRSPFGQRSPTRKFLAVDVNQGSHDGRGQPQMDAFH